MKTEQTKLASLKQLTEKVKRLSEKEQRAIQGGPKGPIPASGPSRRTN